MVILQLEAPATTPANDVTAPPSDWFGQLLAGMHKSLYARARLFSGKHDDALDAVQTTYERAWRRFSDRVPRAHARAWVLRILENVLISNWRASRRACRPILMDDLDRPVEPVAEAPAWEALSGDEIEAALAQLPPRLRDTFRLCELENLCYDQAAARLQVPRATIGTRLFRARRQLRALLERQLA
jgi:RNA polymerase sigma-70 factor (ECF subfamily)